MDSRVAALKLSKAWGEDCVRVEYEDGTVKGAALRSRVGVIRRRG